MIISLILILPTLAAVYHSYNIFRADRIARSSQTVEAFQKAVGHDPSNAKLWWSRGRLRHYSVGEVDIEGARQDYERALQLNPRLSQAWVDLADCYERTGRFAEAEHSFEKAFQTHKYSPLVHWQAGNFYLRRGNLPRMYQSFKSATEYASDKLAIAVNVAWKIDPDHEHILERLVPDNLPSNLLYLSFLMQHDELDLAAPVWRRCIRNEIPEKFEFKPAVAFAYIDRLLNRDRIAEARQVWNEVLRKSGSPSPAGRKSSDPENLVWNGSFETEILRGGFDWRYPDRPEIKFRHDPGNRMNHLKSLRVSFEKINFSSNILSQIVPLTGPGAYQLDFFLRTRSLTTDQMPYVYIHGFPDAKCATARSPQFPSETGWSRISVPFEAGPGCSAILLSIRRDASRKFDNLIKGTIWLDGFVLRMAAADAGQFRISHSLNE